MLAIIYSTRVIKYLHIIFLTLITKIYLKKKNRKQQGPIQNFKMFWKFRIPVKRIKTILLNL